MHGQADMADLRPFDQAGNDHPPADGPLECAKRKYDGQPPAKTLRNGTFPSKPGEGQREGHADQPSKQTMNIFPEENELEIRHRPIAVDCLLLGRLLVEIEMILPTSWVERRNDARDRFKPRNHIGRASCMERV